MHTKKKTTCIYYNIFIECNIIDKRLILLKKAITNVYLLRIPMYYIKNKYFIMVNQKTILDFCNAHNINCSVESRLLDVISELGELSKEVLKATEYGKKLEIHCNEDLALEFGDLLFSITCLANQLNIDMTKALDLVLDKYKKRFNERSTISSE